MRPRVRLFQVSLASVALWFYLGPDNLDMDSESLVVMFDRRGRAVDAVVAQG